MITFPAKYIEIWSSVEKTLKISIPSYIKNVLTYCGFDNVHTISTIEESDLEYIATKVRKGGVIHYFSNELGIENALLGSNKSERNFEFSRGHRKLLLVIVELVKQNLNENGVDGFSVKLSKEKLDTAKIISKSKSKSQKDKQKEHKSHSVSTSRKSEIASELYHTDCKRFFHEIDLQAKLLKQTIQSLYIHSRDMYEKVGTNKCLLYYII